MKILLPASFLSLASTPAFANAMFSIEMFYAGFLIDRWHEGLAFIGYAIIFEAMVIRFAFKQPTKRALKLSLWANLISSIPGLLVLILGGLPFMFMYMFVSASIPAGTSYFMLSGKDLIGITYFFIGIFTIPFFNTLMELFAIKRFTQKEEKNRIEFTWRNFGILYLAHLCTSTPLLIRTIWKYILSQP
ncbi:MAG: hypothetical protein LBH41_01430 [Rickettsiales bacterium]|jgi:hypothetical protein|nr:hypothetical protein [Rickettsiales bacterium]